MFSPESLLHASDVSLNFIGQKWPAWLAQGVRRFETCLAFWNLHWRHAIQRRRVREICLVRANCARPITWGQNIDIYFQTCRTKSLCMNTLNFLLHCDTEFWFRFPDQVGQLIIFHAFLGLPEFFCLAHLSTFNILISCPLYGWQTYSPNLWLHSWLYLWSLSSRKSKCQCNYIFFHGCVFLSYLRMDFLCDIIKSHMGLKMLNYYFSQLSPLAIWNSSWCIVKLGK